MQSSISFTLGANVENLTLTGSGNINGTGNALANILTGNSGNNTLDGGAGADTMVGGARQRHLRGRQRRRRGDRSAQRGHRHGAVVGQLHARRQCREPDPDRQRQHQRHRQRLDNVITGNSGNNMLDGGAAPTHGGDGNDIYVVDNAGDVVTEAAQRRHRHGAVVDHLHARRQCREPDADRQRQHQRHRQRRSPTSSPATAATTSSTAGPAPTP